MPWLLIIMISTCPLTNAGNYHCTGDWDKDNMLALHTVVPHWRCIQEAERIQATWHTHRELHPNLNIEVMCKPNELNQTFENN